MSYPCDGVNCPRELLISSSDDSKRYKNKPTGDNNHDNVRQINEKSVKVANYRQSTEYGITPVESPVKSPMVPPSTSPSSSPSTIRLDCKWNESLLKVIITTNDNPQQVSWNLSRNSVIVDSFNTYIESNTIVTHKVCVLAGSCYTFTINDNATTGGINNGGHVQIIEEEQSVLEVSNFNSSIEHIIPVEGKMKHKIGWPGMDKKECKWLKTTNAWKQNLECSRPYIKGKCVSVCKTCD